MNYTQHYATLINRARNRQLTEDTEIHHIIPRCMHGADDQTNLVELTPEEHYVAHQLLVKMYPSVRGLVWAAIKMTQGARRRNNKLYGWLRRNVSTIAKQRVGDKNGSFGTRWIRHDNTGDSVKISANDPIPDGWSLGRVITKHNLTSKLGKNTCVVCGCSCGSKRYCNQHAAEARALACKKNAAGGNVHKVGKIYVNNGVVQKRIDPHDPVPDGFVVGGIKRNKRT